jgi:hypothetical protein
VEPSTDDLATSEFVLGRAVERATAVLKEIARVSAKDFAFGLPRKILSTLRDEAEAVKADLLDLNKDPVVWNKGTPAAERLASIRTLAARIEVIHDGLTLVHAVDSSRLPFELVSILEQLANQILNATGVEVMLQPSYEYSYSILDLAQTFAGPDFKDTFLISFPSAETMSLAMHTIILHELGHPLFSRIEASIRPVLTKGLVDAQKILSADIEDEVRMRMAAIGIPTGAPLFQPHVKESTNEVLQEAADLTRNWTGEIWCDLVATRLVGPAYICAFQSLMLPFFSTSEASDTHPDNWLRLNIMRKFMDSELSSTPVLKQVSELFGIHQNIVGGIEPPNAADLETTFKIAGHILRPDDDNTVLAEVFSIVRQRIPSPISSPEFLEALKRGIDRTVDLVPPDPFLHFSADYKASPVEIVAYVFYCYWLFKLTRYDEWKAKLEWDDDRCDFVLNNMGIKALEAAQLKHAFRRK